MRRLLVLLIATVAVAGCGSDDEPSSPGTPASAPEATKPEGAGARVEIKDFKYLPAALTVKAGTTVRWTNADSAPHTATADDESFDTGNLGDGEAGTATLNKPGTYAYFCEFHQFMRARITVR